MTSCVASLELRQAVTKKGLINTSRVSLGQFMIWDTEEKTLTRIHTLNVPEGNLHRQSRPSDEEVRFEGSANYLGGGRLSGQEIVRLEAEVSSRSYLAAKGLRKLGYRNIVKAITNEMNSDPDFIDTMNVEEAVESNGRYLYVLVDEQTLGTSLETMVEGTKAVSASGKAQTFDATSANVSFSITDTAALNIRGSEGSDTCLFYRVSVFQPSMRNGSYRFRAVTNREVISDIRKSLLDSSF